VAEFKKANVQLSKAYKSLVSLGGKNIFTA
jgi:hypothetical protein